MCDDVEDLTHTGSLCRAVLDRGNVEQQVLDKRCSGGQKTVIARFALCANLRDPRKFVKDEACQENSAKPRNDEPDVDKGKSSSPINNSPIPCSHSLHVDWPKPCLLP